MIAPQINEASGPRVALCPLGGSVQPELAVILERRGIATNIATISDARRQEVGAIAAVVRSKLTKSMVAELGPLCRDAAVADRPVVLLAPPGCTSSALERSMMSAYLEGTGAIVLADPDVWLETVVFVAAFGLPRGSNIALVFPEHGWLDDAAEALRRERFASRLRARAVTAADASKADFEPTDIVLCDAGDLPLQSPPEGMIVAPLCGRGELVVEGSAPVLVGLRASLAAAEAAGDLRSRIDEGLGLAEREGPDDFDFARITRQLEKLVSTRIGDHETKVILDASGVGITRQAVARSASEAARKAKQLGYPVEMKPWGARVPDELSGCPLKVELRTAADVRRAFAGLAEDAEAAVIVRETPPSGRELSAEILTDRVLGPLMVVRVAGNREAAAAISPLSNHDAARLSRAVAATRADDPQPAVAEVAELLQRASFIHRDVAELTTLKLSRIVAGERAAVVIDAWAER